MFVLIIQICTNNTTMHALLTGLSQVRYNPNFNSERLTRLKDVFPFNGILWPTLPFKNEFSNSGRRKQVLDKQDHYLDENYSFDVVHHHQKPVVDLSEFE